MASHPHSMGRASALPLNLIAQAVPMLTRSELEAVTERLIEYLDALDPNPDIELNGDELDETGAEDAFRDHSYSWRREPGCPISDPDTAIDDGPCDEPRQDLEEEEGRVAIYGIDQTKGTVWS